MNIFLYLLFIISYWLSGPSATSFAQSVSFSAATNFTVGSTPNSVAVGDFNRDGRQDLAVANRNSSNVSILLGNANGSFGAATNFAVGFSPISLAVGDFNGDSNQDLAVVKGSSSTVSILLGNGNGSFNAATNITVGAGPSSVALGDFNADGRQDLAVPNAGSNTISILLGTGNGSFSAATNIPTGTSPSSVAVGDFNADGRQDLAVANAGNANVSILLGNGNGGFSGATNVIVGAGPSSLAVGDFNSDGKQDLAVANRSSSNVSILLGNGDGSFSAATNIATGTSPSSVAVGQFNGDGRQDLAVTNADSNNVSILLGIGNGAFIAATDFAVASSPTSVAVADFTGDGRQDLAVANANSNNVSILLNSSTPNGGGSGSVNDRLSNISTRARVLTGNNVMIGGFTIEGSAAKRILVRSRGPTMSAQPFNVSGTLANPLLQLFSGQTMIAQNDNWQDAPSCQGFVCEGAAAIIATGLAPCTPNPDQAGPPPNCALESALLITLPPGAYTAIVSGANGGTGIGLVEVFEADASALSELSNISTRAFVQSGNDVMIGGVTIDGNVQATVLVRARGPSMSSAPLNVPGTLANPLLQLFSGQTMIAQNDNWQDAPNCSGFVCENAAAIRATGLDPCEPNPGQSTTPPGCAQESAILITLPPGAYTAIVSGVGGGTGVGIVEVFEMD